MATETLADRLKLLRKTKGLNQTEAALGIGRGVRTLSLHETGGTPDRASLKLYAIFYDCDEDWLLHGEGEPVPSKTGNKPTAAPPEGTDDHTYIDREAWAEDIEIPKSKEPPDFSIFHLVPLAEAHLSAGGGAFVLSEDMKEDYAFRRDWLRRVSTSIDNLVLMMVHGASMEPTILADDIVLVDKGQRRIYEGLIYALGHDETIVIKRLALLPRGRALIISDNRSEFPPEKTTLNDIRVIGQVIWFGRQLVKGEE